MIIGVSAPKGRQRGTRDARMFLCLIECYSRLCGHGSGPFGGEQRIERAGHTAINLGFCLRGCGQTLLGYRDYRLCCQCLNPGRLYLGQYIEHTNAITLRLIAQSGTSCADARLAFAAAFPNSLIPEGGLCPTAWRIGAGAGEILDFDTDGIAWPYTGLRDGCIGGTESSGIDRNSRVYSCGSGKCIGKR